MENKSKKFSKGIAAFNTVYIIGIVFAIGKIINDLQWTFQLVKNWTLPEKPFFSKVVFFNNNVDISIEAYLFFAIAYILVFGFVILGLYQLNNTTKLFAKNKVFQDNISLSFKKAGKSFLAFAYGTLIIDVVFLFWAKAASRIVDLLSTELLVFLILGYLMFFLADVFKEGIMLREENDLMI